jgi:hypothetical protein
MTNRNITLTTFLALGCLALSQIAKAVVPAPDGGYPGGNTAEGQNALFSLTSGGFNTAVGYLSLSSNSTGSFNTALGGGTLLANTGEQNTATGAGALLSNTTGPENTANGTFALFNNTTGFGNTALGSSALFSNTTGGTLGTTQTFDVGPNTAIGSHALESNTISSANTAVGYQALKSMVTGFDFGSGPTDLGVSTAVGFQALASANGTNSAGNDAFGYQALAALTDGMDNVAVGAIAGTDLTSGFDNVYIGTGAGRHITTGSDNTFLGHFAGMSVQTANNVIAIGSSVSGVSSAFGEVDDSCYIGNIWGETIDPDTAVAVSVDSDGKLGTTVSSHRFKDDVKPMDQTSETVLALKPVTFHYKSDKRGTPQFGLIAEEVAKVDPDLIVRDKKGEIYTVRYDAVNAMLLNEFLKEHRKVEQLEKQVEKLTAGLQKVSDEIELGKTAPRMVVNHR